MLKQLPGNITFSAPPIISRAGHAIWRFEVDGKQWGFHGTFKDAADWIIALAEADGATLVVLIEREEFRT